MPDARRRALGALSGGPRASLSLAGVGSPGVRPLEVGPPVPLSLAEMRLPGVRHAAALTILLLLLASGFGSALWAAPLPEELSDLESPVLMLADAATGKVLVERNAALPLPPASLAKLMTLHLSLSDEARGLLDRESVYTVPPGAAAARMRPHSSVLGLSAGDRATLSTLQRAAALLSAGDAAWALALLGGGGSAESFVARMNREAARLGMHSTRYTDPDGWSELSSTTGADQMSMALAYVRLHPEALEKLHSPPYMSYSDRDVLQAVSLAKRRKNTNLLTGTYPGADGLKTGTIPSAGYHFLATAQRKGTRLIALCMGLKAADYARGIHGRAEEAARLLDWGFEHYSTWRAEVPPEFSLAVRHGERQSVRVVPADAAPAVTLRREELSRVKTQVDMPHTLTAPLSEGQAAGEVLWLLEGRTLCAVRYVCACSVGRQWHLREAWEALESLFKTRRRTPRP